MASFLTMVGQFFTAAIGMVGDVVSVITAEGNWLLLLYVGILPICMIAIGIFKRLLRTRA